MNYKTINLPVSKSVAARFLVASYFAGSLPIDRDFDDSDDLEVLQEALLNIYTDEEPIDFGGSPLDIHASGTALRFITAVCASSPEADFVVTGTPRLMSRPMKPLIDVLHEAGAEIIPQGAGATGPYRVQGRKLTGGEFSIRGDVSSQFISALMLSAPSWEKGMKLNFTTPTVSRPYIEMTARVMEKFGVKVNLQPDFVEVPNAEYKAPADFKIEADWSAAAFFYEAIVAGSGPLLLDDLTPPADSCQGDSKAECYFRSLGVNTEFNDKGAIISSTGEVPEKFEGDFTDCIDMVPAFAVACLCGNVKFRLTGVHNLRLKESDRLEAVVKESRKLGFVLEAGDDTLSWEGERVEPEPHPVIETYDDHRIAMAFAMAQLRFGPFTISHPEVVEKSFSTFWEQAAKLPV